MTRLFFVALLVLTAPLATACNTVTAQCRVDLQTTDNTATPHRAQEICTADGYTGQLERTRCRGAAKLDKDNLPASCK